MEGRFITVEGTEGVGKSTNMVFIESWLKKQGINVLCTREPGGTPLAEEIRELLLRPRDELVSETAELLLMFAARAQHLEKVILPALQSGTWVLCDRFTDATFAYQGAGRGLSTDTITQLEALVQKGRQPDFTVILDVSPEVGLARAKKRGDLDRFETEALAFFDRVRQGYLQRAYQNSRYAVIDTHPVLDDVQLALEQQLIKWFASASS